MTSPSRSTLSQLAMTLKRPSPFSVFAFVFSKAFKISGYAGVAAGAITGLAVASVKNLGDLGEQLDNLSQQTGISVLNLSALKTSADAMGLSIDTVTGATKKMQINLAAMGEDTKKANDALKPLGLTFADLKNQKPEDQLLSIGNKIAAIKDPTERTAAAVKFFGKSGTELLPFFDKGNASMEDMVATAKKLGTAMDENGVIAAAKADAAFDSLSTSLEGAKNQIAIALVPAITQLVDKISPLIQTVQQWIAANPELFSTIAIVTTAILGLMFILPGLIAGITAIGVAIAFLTSPVGIILLAIAAVTAAFIYLWRTNEGFRNAVIFIWNAIKTYLLSMFENLKIALKIFIDGVILIWNAWSAIFTFIKNIWDQIIGALTAAWARIRDTFSAGMQAAKTAWSDFWNGLYAIVDGVVKNIQSLIDKIVGTITGAVNAVKNLTGAAGGLGNAIGSNIGNAATSFGNFITGKKATGGNMHANRSYIAGEHGAELVTMGSGGGTATPADQIGGIHLTITGNTFLDSQAAIKMGNLLMGQLRLQRKLE